MIESVEYPRQGQVYLSKALRQSADSKKRPVTIVSLDARNQFSRTVLVVPFSSDLHSGSGNPSRIFVPTGEGGLEVDSIALCDLISTVEKKYLERGPYGRITGQSLAQIQRGIQLAIGLHIP